LFGQKGFSKSNFCVFYKEKGGGTIVRSSRRSLRIVVQGLFGGYLVCHNSSFLKHVDRVSVVLFFLAAIA
jgi:hypothetical protein